MITEFIGNAWPYLLALTAVFILWKFFTLLVLRKFGIDIINKLNWYGGGDLRRDRTPGFFGKRGR